MIGRFCGPTIASFVYIFSGIFFTYIFFGIVTLGYSILLFQLDFKETHQGEKEKSGFLSGLLKAEVLLLSFAQFLNRMCRSFFAPTFTNSIMKKFSVSIEFASHIQATSFIGYWFTFRNFDFLIKNLGVKILIVFGLFINFLGAINLGPISILPQ